LKKIRIAAASSDGLVVDSHFGRAGSFYIFETDEEMGDGNFLEIRKMKPICTGGDHDEKQLEKNVEMLCDCQYLLCAKIGEKTEHFLESKGITAFELPGYIDESFLRMSRYLSVRQMLE
jgi:predicted Fe-Mo cluster-binding NifX family protein